VIDLYEDVQQHSLKAGKQPVEIFNTESTWLQKKNLRLLGISKAYKI